ncbi:MAG: glycosyltransferase family A protein [Hyphomicrobiales bacterium]|nr:glycosyltransferase family A protein [Hyphomicrobiales bacterium]
MKVGVIIPTVNRSKLVTRLLSLLEEQSRAPDEVIVSAPDESHVEPYAPSRFALSFCYGPPGLCAQRNRAMEIMLPRADVISFFDDDFLPGRDYLAHIEAALTANPDWAVINGYLIADGAHSPTGYTFEEGLALLRAAEAKGGCPNPGYARTQPGAYGCNMSIRARHVGALRFDERLPLYGWQEDIDFTSQLGAFGRIVSIGEPMGVHLAEKSGRVSGVKFGYSQVSNPVYLMRKGTMPIWFGLELMFRNIAANLVKSIRPEALIDRRGRLNGNLRALAHLARGRIEPEYILKL